MSTPKRRRMWDEVLPGWRHAHDTTRDHGASRYTRAVLEAALYLLAAHQRTEDRVRLSQVAHEAGLWDGTGDCPRASAAAAGRQLAHLASIGALHYEPDRSRRGCLIRLYTADEVAACRATSTRDTDTSPRATSTRDDGPRRATSTRDTDEPVARPEGGPSRDLDAPVARSAASRRATRSRASEGFPEDEVRGEEPEGARAGPTGTASGGPSADPDDWGEEEPDPPDDRLTKILRALRTDDTVGSPDDLAAFAIDQHLAEHVPDLRELIAIEIESDAPRPGQVRLAMRSARAVAERYGRDFPKLDF